MLSMHDNEQYFFESLKVGASGYVLKSVADEDLVAACRAALRGETFLYPGARARWCATTSTGCAAASGCRTTVLTAREDEVIKLIAEGRSSREIAKELTISAEDRRAAPRQHPGQARHARPDRAHALRDPGRADRAVARPAPVRLTRRRRARGGG